MDASLNIWRMLYSDYGLWRVNVIEVLPGIDNPLRAWQLCLVKNLIFPFPVRSAAFDKMNSSRNGDGGGNPFSKAEDGAVHVLQLLMNAHTSQGEIGRKFIKCSRIQIPYTKPKIPASDRRRTSTRMAIVLPENNNLHRMRSNLIASSWFGFWSWFCLLCSRFCFGFGSTFAFPFASLMYA